MARVSTTFWKAAALLGIGWLAALGLSRAAVTADEPKPGIPWSQQKSGLEFQSKSNRERQEDLTANPGMLWVDQGAVIWTRKEGAGGKSCQDCHGEPERMKSVATRYPAFDAKANRMHSLETRIQATLVIRVL